MTPRSRGKLVAAAALRPALAALAAAVCAWFLVQARDAAELAQATALVARHPPPGAAGAARVASLLNSASPLTPGTAATLVRARLDLERGERAPARRLLEPVVRDEPMNVEAWVLYAQAVYPDIPLLRVAVRNIRLLDPRG